MADAPMLTVVSLWDRPPGGEVELLTFDEHGIREDSRHYGPTRIVNARSRVGHPKPPIGSVEDNWRMWSAISLEDLRVIEGRYRRRYGRDVGAISPGWLGPNFVVTGMKRFSKLPDGTLLTFTGGVELRVTSETKSCSTPGKLIAAGLRLPVRMAGWFPVDADGYRGVVGTVVRGGVLRAGETAAITRAPARRRKTA